MSANSKKYKIIIFIVIIIVIVFVLNIFSKQTRGFFYSLSLPLQKVFWRAGDRVSDFFEGLIRMESLKNEADELRNKNQELLSQIIFLREKGEENDFLRGALEIDLAKDFELKMAQLIFKEISSDFILIDKGKEDGIEKDMPVITQERVLVGKISEVYDKFSKVMLISDKNNSFDVEVSNLEKEESEQGDICVVAKGKGNLNVFLDFIPRDKEIFEGDIIITSSLGAVFPKGLLVGRVSKVIKNDVESFHQADIDLFFDITETDYLFVIAE